jgi:dTDP-4-amino-4,6-dideoxygalactose transaminase
MHTSLKPKKHMPFALPDISHQDIQAVVDVLKTGWLTTGPQVSMFESEFASMVCSKYSIAINSCTAALHLALEAIGLSGGDEVVTAPYSFAATAEVIRYFNARPVFVDVDPIQLNLDVRKVDKAITRQTKVILPVHIAGLPADLDGIGELSRKHNVATVEDAAHAFPSKYLGRYVGSISDITCFSFYATKTITTGEGGMICTENEEYADRCRIMSLHGISKDAWKRYSAQGSWYYEIVAPGYKYNMTDIAAAMGLAQLRKANTMWEKRVRIAKAYNEAFGSMPQLQLPADDPRHQHAWHLYMLRLHLDTLTIDRARFIEEMKSRQIGVSVHFIPLHIHPYYRDLYGFKPNDFPVAYREFLREMSLPIYSKMSENDVARVIEAVQEIVRKFKR